MLNRNRAQERGFPLGFRKQRGGEFAQGLTSSSYFLKSIVSTFGRPTRLLGGPEKVREKVLKSLYILAATW